MNKHIEKVEQYKQKVLEKELENLRAKYHEAEYSYADTGQDKYFNKMSIYEKQINEIEEYLKPKDEITLREYKELKNLRWVVKNAKSKVFYIFADWPDGLPPHTELINLRDMLRDYNYIYRV